MPSRLQPLPEDVASRIAAGEVIERPASVLKELVENSLDAGASKIEIEIKGAGCKLIRVADDGDGVPPEDCARAFERHTTSKIRALQDLEKLSTFGFRGEALFSIAAVSKTTLASRAKGERRAWRVEFRGGRLHKEHEAPPAAGTAIEVRDLFFNTPARAKFLKSDATERSHLARVVEEAALANPAVAFTYCAEGKIKLRCAAQKNDGRKAQQRRVAEVLGEEYGRELLCAEGGAGGLTVRGLFSPPETLHATRGFQYVFVNRRPVTNRTVQQALYRAYEPFRGRNRHPAAVLFIDVPSAELDVNVHPTKREVRFRPAAAVYQAVTQTLSKALLEARSIPTIQTAAENIRSAYHAAGEAGRSRAERPVAEQSSFVLEAPAGYPAARPLGRERVWYSDDMRYLGQIERTYLLFETGGGLLIMDQHAAQEKVLFERYIAEVDSGKLHVQELMLPLALDLPASGIEKILAKKKRLLRAGFTVEALGKTTLHITSTPALFAKAHDIKEMVQRLLDSLLSPSSAAADVRYDATATIACKAAVKAHDALSEREARALVKDLRACADGTCCPHGRPTMLHLDRFELARRFGRSGAPPLDA
ncbi:MAG: DNA mismatch repair endonuclease MutL [Elusimicrobiota bacterium]